MTPLSVFDFDLATRERKLLKATEVPGGFDPKNYVTERVAATAADGTKVPLSIVYRKGLIKDGKAPLFLYGYGILTASLPTRSSIPRGSCCWTAASSMPWPTSAAEPTWGGTGISTAS